MVRQGARHIVLLSRGGVVTDELEHLIDESSYEDATIYVKACDVANEASVEKLVAECHSDMPPIRGVIHAAMVLRVCTTFYSTIQVFCSNQSSRTCSSRR
jgi:NAD(P)-dependent dehydrogenase (short-subunit alcohol dehydrogenase family)